MDEQRMPEDPILYNIEWTRRHRPGQQPSKVLPPLRTKAELVADGTEFLATEPEDVEARIERAEGPPAVWEPGHGRHRRPKHRIRDYLRMVWSEGGL